MVQEKERKEKVKRKEAEGKKVERKGKNNILNIGHM